MKKLKKQIISGVLLIIGLLLIIISVQNITGSEEKKLEIEQNLPVRILNFNVNKENSNEVNISFDIENASEESYPGDNLLLNFYDDQKLLYTYEYSIRELESLEMISVSVTLNFEYKEITNYEFVLSNIKKSIIPTNF